MALPLGSVQGTGLQSIRKWSLWNLRDKVLYLSSDKCKDGKSYNNEVLIKTFSFV